MGTDLLLTVIFTALVVAAAVVVAVVLLRRRAAARAVPVRTNQMSDYDGRYGDAAPAGKPDTTDNGVSEAGAAAEVARSRATATGSGLTGGTGF